MTPETPRLLRLLFVEDNESLCESMTILLEADGRDVVACASAEEALAFHRAKPFDVVITDVSLEGRSGIDLARDVLALDPAAWVVLSSGLSLDPALLALGPNVRLLPKPYESATIEAILAEVR